VYGTVLFVKEVILFVFALILFVSTNSAALAVVASLAIAVAFAVILDMLDVMLLVKTNSAARAVAASAVIAVAFAVILVVFDATLVFKEVILEVLDVILFVADVILVSKVAMVAEFTPPTVFTVGDVAVPLKSPANCMIPFADVDASDGAAVVTAEVTKAVVAICIVFVPSVAVGACGTPVNKGDAKGAPPKLDNAVAAEFAFVPPLAIATVPEILLELTVDEIDGIFKVVPDKVAAPVPVVVKVNDADGALPYPCPIFQ
jgi:hypothetical protein